MPDSARAQWTEEQRLKSLQRYCILDTPPEQAFEEIVQLAAEVCETPIAIISFVDELRQWFKAEHGLGRRQTPRAIAICAQAMMHPGIFTVCDLSADPRFAENPLVADDPRLRFYASVQLLDPDGIPLGTLSVLDRACRPEGLTERQGRMLRALGRQVISELELRGAAANKALESRRFQTLFEQAPIVLALSQGAEHELQYCNRAFREFFCGTDLAGRPVEEVLGGRDAGTLFADVQKVFDTGVPIARIVNIRVPPSEAGPALTRSAELILQPIVGAGGDVTGVLLVGSDVTEARAAKARAAVLENCIAHERQVSAMSTMAKTLAHEINQPLTAAKNYFAVARQVVVQGGPGDNERAAEMLGLAEEQLLRAGRIIHSVRDLVGRSPARREDVAIGELFDRVTKLLEAGSEAPGRQARTKLCGGDCRVLADPVQAEQVLLNLLRNAHEAGGEGAEIVVSAIEEANGLVEICVRDNGPGIPAEVAPTLFTGFTQSKSGGLGVGLSICATIVQAHGGTIRAVNLPHGGAAFCFTLPAACRHAS